MKAVLCKQYGLPDTLVVEDIASLVPAAGQVVVSMKAAGVNFPDALIIQDPTLLHQVDVFAGLKRDGYLLINTRRSFDDLGLGDFVKGWHPERLCTVCATELALKHVGRPVPNVPLLGGFAAVTGLVHLESVLEAIRQTFSGKVAAGNIAAATEAFDIVQREMQAATEHA